ncbi:MAG: hypothetical protein JO265_12455, partial [Acidimicrobiia bacterium]|nr:hypothetical protein [Acidimicrobiia bacterium]
GSGAAAGTTTVITNGSIKFYKTVNGSLSVIKVGDRLTAMGTPDANATSSLTASRITDTGTMTGLFGGPGGGGRRGVSPNGNGSGAGGSTLPPNPNGGTRPDPNSLANGTVKAISGSTLTVTQADGTTKTVNTTGSTAVTVLKAVGIGDLATGQPIVVRGTTNSDGTVTATSVLQGVGGFGRGGGFGGFRGGPNGQGGQGGSGGQAPDTGPGTGG